MSRKWIGILLVPSLVVVVGIGNQLSLADDHETPLGKIMEQVQKHNITITKGTRNATTYKKSQKDVAKAAKELVKLSKEAKPFTDYLKNAKDAENPQQKWDEIMDAFTKYSEELAEKAADETATQKDVKDVFQNVKKTCSDCHTVFRVEDDF